MNIYRNQKVGYSVLLVQISCIYIYIYITYSVYLHLQGGGQYGDVYEAVWKRYNKTVAVKTLKVRYQISLS